MWREALLTLPMLAGAGPEVRPIHVPRPAELVARLPERLRPPAARRVAKPAKQAAVKPAAKIERATDLTPGESLTYRVLIHGIESARAALAVGKPGREDSRRVIPLRGAVEPLPALRAFVPFRADMVSYVDRREGVPRRTLSSRTIDGREVRLETRYLTDTFEVRQDGGKPITRPARAPGAHDALTALYSLRARAHPAGERLRWRVLDGRAEHRVEIVAGAIETVDTPMGSLAAQRFDGHWRLPGRRNVRKFSLWLTADDARVPVRLEGQTHLGLARFDLIAPTTADPKSGSRSARRR